MVISTKRQSGSIRGKPVALVTGASSGFGLLITAALAAGGYQVVAVLRSTSRREELLETLGRKGLTSDVLIAEADVTDEAAVHRLAAETVERYGSVELLVNNAGYAAGGFIEEVPLSEWRRQMDTNFFGLVSMTQAVLPYMRIQRRGCIINMSSISGRSGFPGYAPYAASKFAVEGFSESLRLELAPYGVKVVLVEPGAYRTSIWSKGFAGMNARPGSAYGDALDALLRYSQTAAAKAADPQEVADAVVRIASLRNPRLRYPLGFGTRLTLGAKALLPWRWFERLVRRTLR